MERLSVYTTQSETREFARVLLAKAHAALQPQLGDATAQARRLVDTVWSDTPFVFRTIEDFQRKAAVGGTELGAGPSALTSVARQTFTETVLGRLPGAQRLPFHQSALAGQILGVGAAWRREGMAIPVSRAVFSNLALQRYSVGALVVCSMEFIELSTADNSAQDTLAALLRDAVRAAFDTVFVGTSAVSAVQPAGIAENAVGVASTGATAAALAADVRSMVDAMVAGVGSIRNAVWVVSAEAFALLATLKVLDANGTTLAGRPVISDAPSGTFLLVDGASLFYAVADDFAEIRASTSAMIEMSDTPTGDMVTPTAASQSRISLFQDDAIALRASLAASWGLADANATSSGNPAVIQLTGASYA